MDTSSAASARKGRGGLRAIPRSIWALGLVSLFMDASSELIHSLLPLFMTTVLGTSVLVVGLIEGIAEATASIVKVFSGALSDYLGRRKLLTVIGYGLAALTKPLFPLAGSAGMVLSARFLDRIGKGIRGAPRDALIGDIAPPDLRGASYGLRQALDTAGAFAGPLLAIGLMMLLAGDIRAVFWIAVIPAFIALAVLIVGVREPESHAAAGPKRSPIRFAELKGIGSAYWGVVVFGALLALARFSEAFLLLRADSVGLAIAFAPLVMVVMNLVYALSAYPAGALSDRMDRRSVIAIGCTLLIIADLLLALAGGPAAMLAGVAVWGLHMGLTQGLLAAMIADAAPPDLRGTAFGVFNLISGVAMLIASLLAGWLWQVQGPAATFLAGAALTALALLCLAAIARQP
ncbi:MAG: MFS transporter [Alphaproteobacteria bacterium]